MLIILQGNIDSSWKVGIPILAAVFVFVANIIYQRVIKRHTVRERLGNEIIHASDRMLRKFVDAEGEALLMRFHKKMMDITPNEKNYKLHEGQFFYYQKRAEDSRYMYYSLKSDLVRLSRDFNSYWHNKTNKTKIITIMAALGHINPRRFEKEFESTSKEADTINHYTKIADAIPHHSFFESIGIHIVYLQRLIDPGLPLLYITSNEQLELLNSKLKKYEKNLTLNLNTNAS